MSFCVCDLFHLLVQIFVQHLTWRYASSYHSVVDKSVAKLSQCQTQESRLKCVWDYWMGKLLTHERAYKKRTGYCVMVCSRVREVAEMCLFSKAAKY